MATPGLLNILDYNIIHINHIEPYKHIEKCKEAQQHNTTQHNTKQHNNTECRVCETYHAHNATNPNQFTSIGARQMIEILASGETATDSDKDYSRRREEEI